MTDIFLCHASEDKDDVARPLAHLLQTRGVSVWYDEFCLHVGDSLRGSIDRGLSQCDYGIVILSDSFFEKKWPRDELDGLTAIESARGRKLILPVWHKVDVSCVSQHSPTLAGKLAVDTKNGLTHVVERIMEAVHAEETRRGYRSLQFNTGFGGNLKVGIMENQPPGPLDKYRADLISDEIREVFERHILKDLKKFESPPEKDPPHKRP